LYRQFKLPVRNRTMKRTMTNHSDFTALDSKTGMHSNNVEGKLSAALIEIAQPFIDIVDETTTEQFLQQVFGIVATVWNCLVLDVLENTTKYTNMLRKQLKGIEPDFLIEMLIIRKQELFPNDLRVVGDHSITYKDGRLNVRVEAHCPPTQGN